MMDFKGVRFSRTNRQAARFLRLRVESCINTVLDLNEKLGEGKIKPEIIEQFERLRDSLSHATDETVDERDISRIEDATNQLLIQIKNIYGEDIPDSLYEGRRH